MLLDQLDSTRTRINQILRLLRENHQFEFPLQEPHKWHQLLEQNAQVQSDVKRYAEFNTYHADPKYIRAVLITEAVRLLMEIAPRRMKKKVKEGQQPQDNTMPRLNEKASKAKPDFLDVDKDGNKTEPFKKALKDKANKVDEAKSDPEADRLRDEWLAKHSPEVGNTRVAKNAREIRIPHHGVTATASAQSPYIRPTSIPKTTVKESSSDQEFEVTFVDDHSDDPQTTIVRARDINQARIRFRVDYPGTYVEKIVMKKNPLKEDANLDQAETLLAAKDMSDRLQGMAEDAAKMAVDRLMPLVDTMKSQFGQPAAEGFNTVVKGQLQTVLDTIVAAKDATDNAILALQNGETPTDGASSDITSELPMDTAPEADASVDGATDDQEVDFDKEFDAVPAASGPEQEPLGRARKEAVSEAKKRNPYAIGMAQAKKEMGYKDTPESGLPKKVITRAHEIARAIEKEVQEQALSESQLNLQTLINQYKVLHESLQQHQTEFKASGAPDPLGLGRGWQGDAILIQMRELANQIQETRENRKQLKAHLAEQAKIKRITQARVAKLNEQVSTTPYGVMGMSQKGTRVKKFFESAIARDMWIDYNKDQLQTYDLINPERVAQVRDRLSRTK